MARRPVFPTSPIREPLVNADGLALLHGWATRLRPIAAGRGDLGRIWKCGL